MEEKELFAKIQDRKLKINKLVDKLIEVPELFTSDVASPFYAIHRKITDKQIKYIDSSVDSKLKFIKIKKYKLRRLKRIYRKTTVPINIPVFRYLVRKNKGINIPAILRHGIHYIYGLPGAGKTSLVYDIIEHLYQQYGFGSYVNAHFEKPKYDEAKDTTFLHHPYFEIGDHFGKTEYQDKNDVTRYKITQLKKFDRRFKNIVFDEVLSWLNHRQNNTSDYLEIFIALIGFLAQRRHRHIKRVYFLNQLDTTDIQLMSAFNYTHEVQVILHIPYKEWVETGELTKHIKGWKINTYKYGAVGKKTADNKYLVETHYRKATADFKYYETLAHQQDDNTPGDYIPGYMG